MKPVINQIEVSGAVLAKINSKHGVTLDDMYDACENIVKSGWIEDPERGPRLLIEGLTASGRKIRVILYPDDPDAGTWRLGTAL
jgi:hypothetical protein